MYGKNSFFSSLITVTIHQINFILHATSPNAIACSGFIIPGAIAKSRSASSFFTIYRWQINCFRRSIAGKKQFTGF
jgi:hypothetical protein